MLYIQFLPSLVSKFAILKGYSDTTITVSLITLLLTLAFAIRSIRNTPPTSLNGKPCKPPLLRPDKWGALGLEGLQGAIAAHKNQENPIRFLGMHERLGDTFAFKMFGARSIVTREPMNVQAVLAKQFNDFGMGPDRKGWVDLLGAKGIFTQNGPEWFHSRSLLRPTFDRVAVADLEALEPYFQTFVNKINDINSNSEGWRELDIQEWIQALLMDTSAQFLLGGTVDALSTVGPHGTSSVDKSKSFAECFDETQRVLARRLAIPSLWWLINPKEFKGACEVVHSTVDTYVKRALNLRISHTEKYSKYSSSSGKYIFLEALAHETQDPEALRDQLMGVIMAGRDTTSGLLSWTFRMLSTHPGVLATLRAEIAQAVGVGALASCPSQEQLRSLKYLQAVLKEVLRLYPPSYINARYAVAHTTLPLGGGPDGKSPIAVAKGDRIIYSVFSVHRRKDIYGKDAEIFRPERWLDGELTKVGWGYLPFSGGPRVCLGQQMALTHASYVVTRIIQTWGEINEVAEKHVGRERYDAKLVLFNGSGVWVGLR